MNCTACTVQLHDYADGTLAAREVGAVEAHLASCAACQAQLASLRALLTAAAALPKEISPSRDLWRGLEASIATADTVCSSRGSEADSKVVPLFSSSLRRLLPFAIAASVALLITLSERRSATRERTREPGPAWSIATLAGAPRINARAVPIDAQFRLGQWLETDATSSAKVAVGSIGEVTVDPNSRLRLTGTGATDHRLELERGTLRAFIWAPPRLFFVDTPSATAIDLGCAYTLTVAKNGDGELHVTTGYVALEHGDREAIIPARAMCLTRRGAGPGTPFADDAPTPLRAALERFDFERDAALAVLPAILAQARAEDAVTLWHLLARTSGPQRAAVFDALAQHHPPPAGVTREGILAGDAPMRRAWATELGLGTFVTR